MTMSTSFLSVRFLQSLEKAAARKATDTPMTPTRASPLPNLYLTLKVQQAFATDPALQNLPIVVETFAGVVHLSGVVKARYQEMIAVHVAGGVRGVHAIRDHLQIAPAAAKSR